MLLAAGWQPQISLSKSPLCDRPMRITVAKSPGSGLGAEFIEAASMAEKKRHQRLGGKSPQPAVGTYAFSKTA